MDTLKALSDIWPVLTALGALLVWAMRLEWRLKLAEKRVEGQSKAIHGIETDHAQLESRVVEELTRVREILARIEGRLGLDHGRDIRA